MRLSLLLLGSLCTMSASPLFAQSVDCSDKIGVPGDVRYDIESGGFVRTFYLHVPELYAGDEAMPLVVNFHGLDSWAAQQEERSHFNETGDEEGFIVATPEGYGASWNGGICCNPAVSDGVDDVQFARDLVETVSNDFCVDPDRVFASGFSNGALMSHRLGCEASDVFAAIAPASGLLGLRECTPPRKVPVIQDHGTLDFSVPKALGYASNEYWAEYNMCPGDTTTVYEVGGASCFVYDGCADNATVEWCEIAGMQHEWPTWDTGMGWFDATETFWAFFAEHPMPR